MTLRVGEVDPRGSRPAPFSSLAHLEGPGSRRRFADARQTRQPSAFMGPNYFVSPSSRGVRKGGGTSSSSRGTQSLESGADSELVEER
jgi:hypothetical protein